MAPGRGAIVGGNSQERIGYLDRWRSTRPSALRKPTITPLCGTSGADGHTLVALAFEKLSAGTMLVSI